MSNARKRLQSQLTDIEQAMVEARSADVRELLRDLLDACRASIAQLDDEGAAAAAAAVRRADGAPAEAFVTARARTPIS